MPEPVTAVYLAFDYGVRRIGVAVGDNLTASARPLATLNHAQQPDWQALGKLVKDWHPAALIVGLPLAEDGSEQTLSLLARSFSAALQSRFQLPVYLADERFSSRSADDTLRERRSSGQMNRRVRKGDRDGQAARLILEQWLAEHG